MSGATHQAKKEDVTIGGSYSAKVGSRTIDVRIDSENAKGGWNATGVDSGKPVRVKDARHLRAPSAADGERCVEPAEEGGDGSAPADDDLKRKRGGKNAKAPKAPKEKVAKVRKPAKDKGPKAMSCLDAAAAVLKSNGEPMRCADMIAAMKEKGLWETTAPTPAATLYSALLREITKKGAASRFTKTDRGLFALGGK